MKLLKSLALISQLTTPDVSEAAASPPVQKIEEANTALRLLLNAEIGAVTIHKARRYLEINLVE